MCRQILKQPKGGLRMLRIYGADAERQDFPVPKKVDHPGIQTFKVQAQGIKIVPPFLHCSPMKYERLMQLYHIKEELSSPRFFPSFFPIAHAGPTFMSVAARPQAVSPHLRRFSWHWRCHAAAGEEPSEEAVACRQAYDRLKACGVRSPDFEETSMTWEDVEIYLL
jgi:hypothetical protein